MAEIDKSITRTILRVGWLDIKMMIPLVDEKEALIDDYSKAINATDTNHYLSIKHFPMVIIDCTKKELSKAGRKKSLIMTARNQSTIVRAFQEMKEILLRDDVFFIKGNMLFTYELTDALIVKEYGAGNNNYFVMHPTVINMVGEDRQYEGVRLYFNGMDISVELAVDEFEAVLNVLKKIDIFLYSQALINFYMIYKDKIVKTEPPKQKKLFNVVPPPPPEKEKLVSTIVKKNSNDNLLAGLEGEEI